MKITNTQAGPRGVHGVNGPVSIPPGATVEVEMSKEELAVARKTGWFSFDDAKKEDAADDGDARHRARR